MDTSAKNQDATGIQGTAEHTAPVLPASQSKTKECPRCKCIILASAEHCKECQDVIDKLPKIKLEEIIIKCPLCAEPIQATAKKCRHCGSYIDGSNLASRLYRQYVKPYRSWIIGGLIGSAIFRCAGSVNEPAPFSEEERALNQIRHTLSTNYLLAPSSAKWITGNILKHENNHWQAYLEVDAQNAYGTLIRNKLCVVVHIGDKMIHWNKEYWVEANCNPLDTNIQEAQRRLTGWGERPKPTEAKD